MPQSIIASSTTLPPLPQRLVIALLPSLFAMAIALPAQAEECTGSHRIVISEAQIGHEPGDILGLPAAIADRFERRLEAGGHQVIKVISPTRSRGLEPAMDAFSRHGAPYFLRLVASDLGTEGRPSGIVLLPDRYEPRGGQLAATLDDGAQGTRLDDWRIDLTAANGKPFSPEIAADSTRFWESDWGESLDAAIGTVAEDVLDTLGCRPLVGRVLSTESRGGETDLRIDLGRADGLAANDRLIVIEPGVPTDSLGVNLLTRPVMEITAGPVREPMNLGQARVTFLGENDATVRYQGNRSVERGDLVQVQ